MALVNVAKGISPFAMIDLSEEYISVATQHNEDLQSAKVVSVTEVRTKREKTMDQKSASAEEFTLML